MTQPRWKVALRAHRATHFDTAGPDHARLMFAACSESVASAELLAAFPTAYVLQMLGGLPRELDEATRATLEYGVLANGVRQIVVCGHLRCKEPGGALTPETSQAVVVARCRALQADDYIGPILRRAHVTMRAMWLEEASRELYACDFEGRPARCMGDDDLAAMFASFDEVSS